MDELLSEFAPREGGEDALVTGPRCRLGVSGSILRSRIMARSGIAMMLQPQQLEMSAVLPIQTKDEGEIPSVRRRFWIASVLAVPVALIGMAPHMLGWAPGAAMSRTLRILELAL